VIFSELMYVRKELERIAYSLSYQSLQFMPEFEVRVRVLKRLRYLGSEDQLKLKGEICLDSRGYRKTSVRKLLDESSPFNCS
jgi:superfamily II RNA helicase